MESHEFAVTIHQRLLDFYGFPKWRKKLPPLDELVSTILSQNTNDTNRDRAFQNLKRIYPTWEAVRDAEPSQVIEAIQTAGLANQKGPRIQKILSDITEEKGNLDLSFLSEMTTEEARKWLLQHKGVGPKTAAIVLQFSLDRSAFPVDTHIFRVTGRLGIRPPKMNADQAHQYLENLFPPESYYPAHLNIIRLGREICHPRTPDCPHCPLQDLCEYFANIESVAKSID